MHQTSIFKRNWRVKLQSSCGLYSRTALSLVVILLGCGLQLSDRALPGQASVQRSIAKAGSDVLQKAYAQNPLGFESNQGQVAEEVKFLARGNGYGLFLTADEAVLALRGSQRSRPHRSPKEFLEDKAAPRDSTDKDRLAVLKMRVTGANKNVQVSSKGLLASKSNYFVGSDPGAWRVNVPHYAQVRYENVYPGINLVYYGNQRELEYDFVVKPGADLKQIKLAFEGVEKTYLAPTGELVLQTEIGEIRHHTPVIYQAENGARKSVSGRYLILGENEIGFAVGDYDAGKDLVIDPVLVYSTYLGGFDNEYGNGIEADPAGNAYVTGITYSVDYPTKLPLQSSLRGVGNAWVAKFDATGKLIYSTFLGGSGEDVGFAITADSAGNAYVTGTASSSNFPVTNGAVQTNKLGGLDAFVAKLSANGDNLLFSTFLGGQADDTGNSIALDNANNVYVTGQTLSTNFPLMNPWQGSLKGPSDAFLTKLTNNGSSLVYSTFLGGSGREAGFGISVDPSGSPYVTGLVYSTDFPTRNAAQASNGGLVDAFITKFNAAGSALVYSTYFGGAQEDGGYGIGVDSPGNAYIAGFTNSANFPTKSAAQAQSGGGDDAVVLKLDSNGALVYSTYLGGSGNDRAFDLAVAANGATYVAGRTDSINFPVKDAVQPKLGTGGQSSLANQVAASKTGSAVELYGRETAAGFFNSDASLVSGELQQQALDGFVAKYSNDGKVDYVTYLGGGSEEKCFSIAADNRGNAYVTGLTASGNFPVKNPVQQTLRGVADAFITKIADVGNTQTTVSAASFVGETLAPDQIVASFGTGLAPEIRVATTLPLPTNLQGTEVRVLDSKGVERLASLFFVSPTQINFAIPTETAEGAALITVLNQGAIVSSETIQIAKVSPGLFTANATGRDVLAGVLLRIKSDGRQLYESVARYDASLGRYVPVPIEFNNDQLYLLAYGTGLRYRGGLLGVLANIGGTSSEVTYAGAQGNLIGLDQINIALSPTLAGRGEVTLAMTVDGKSANPIKVSFK